MNRMPAWIAGNPMPKDGFSNCEGTRQVDLFDSSIVGVEKAMQGSLLQQQVLANNIANANTPGFRPSTVDFQSALAQAFAGAQGSPSPGQIQSISFQPQTDATAAEQIDGNGVDINQQMASLSENTLDYQALESVMGTRMSILKTAIGSA
jgi:flagellar basal-body rod protein FlgB